MLNYLILLLLISFSNYKPYKVLERGKILAANFRNKKIYIELKEISTIL